LFSSFPTFWRIQGKAKNLDRRLRGDGPRQRKVVPRLEPLEDRSLPSVMFMPQFGNEVADDTKSGLRLRNTHVYLLFWGSYWNTGPGGIEAQEIQGGISQVLASSYLSSPIGAAQYRGVNGQFVTPAGAVIDPSNPPSNFTYFDIDSEVQHAIAVLPGIPRPSTVEGGTSAGGQATFYVNSAAPVYMVVTPPSVTSKDIGGFGFHIASTPQVFSAVDAEVEIFGWAGTNLYAGAIHDAGQQSDPIVDSAIGTLSHEITESLSDPIGGYYNLPNPLPGLFSPFAGVTVTPGSHWNSSANTEVELSDFEPDGGNGNYAYRLGGDALHPNGFPAQAYWSQNATYLAPNDTFLRGAFVVPDGNAQYLLLEPIWSPATTFSSNSQPTHTYSLIINGDQLGSNYSDQLAIDATSSGTKVNLNGEEFIFDPGTITNITVNLGGGNNTINIQDVAYGQTVNVNDGGRDAINIGLNGSVQGIQGTVSMVNVPSYTALTVDDSKDRAGHTVTITSSSITGLATARINFRAYDLSSLLIEGSQAASTYNVQGTPHALALTTLVGNAHSGRDEVFVGNGNTLTGLAGNLTLTDTVTRAMAVTIDDSKDPNTRRATITNSAITGLAPYATISYVQGALSVLNIQGSHGISSVYRVQSTPSRPLFPPGTNLTINGANASVFVGNANVQGIAGPLNISDNTLFRYTLTVDDSLDSYSRTVTISSAQISGLAPADITYSQSDLQALYINGSDGGNVVTVSNTPHNVPLLLDTENGISSVRVLATNGPLSIFNPFGVAAVTISSAHNTVSTIAGPITLSDLAGFLGQHSSLLINNNPQEG